MDTNSEAQLQAILGIPKHIWLGQIDIDHAKPELGVGSDAIVHRTSHDGFHVAAKVLHRILIADSNPGRQAFIRGFGDECRRLRQLKHPSIVSFIGVGQAPNGSPCLVVELMEGTLAAKIGASHPDSLLQSLSYMVNVAAGLRYLHWLDIIHRDLKPQNILIAAGIAKIADVGLARTLHGDSPLQQQIMSRCPGTPNYMAPESLDEGTPYDQSLDIFAAGVILIALLTNKEAAPKARRVMITADGQQLPTSELERRTDDVALLDHNHPAREVAIRCIDDVPANRPTANDFHVELRKIQQAYIGTDQVVLTSQLTAAMAKLTANQEATSHSQELNDTVARLHTVEQELASTKQDLTLTRQYLSSTQQRMADISAELAQTTRHLNDTQRQLQLLQGSTAQQSLTTRQELSANKQEQASTRHQLSSTNRELTSTRQDVERLQAALEAQEALLRDIVDTGRAMCKPEAQPEVYAPEKLPDLTWRHHLHFDPEKCSRRITLSNSSKHAKYRGDGNWASVATKDESSTGIHQFSTGIHQWSIRIVKVSLWSSIGAGVSVLPRDGDMSTSKEFFGRRRAYYWWSSGDAHAYEGGRGVSLGKSSKWLAGDLIMFTLDRQKATLQISMRRTKEERTIAGLLFTEALYPTICMYNSGDAVELC